ncbi:MAG: hypothetical protein ABL936_08400 [Aestuariivirga sp.]
MAKFFLTLFGLIFFACLQPAEASVEIWRNQQQYNLDFKLPNGAKFNHDGVDRTFELGGVQGNFRLIQDDYQNCTNLIDERVGNKAKEGFTSVLNRKPGQFDCAVKLRNGSTGQTASSFYIFLEKCQCFSALHLVNDDASEKVRNEIVQGLLDQIRANNPPDADWAAKQDNDNEYLTCDQRRARGMIAGDDEYDMCGLGSGKKKTLAGTASGDKKTKTEKEVSLRETLKKLKEQREKEKLQEEAELQAEQDRQHAENERRHAEQMRLLLAEQKKRQSTVTFKVTNSDPYKVELSFYSMTRKNRAWPGGNKVYVLADSLEHTFTLSCKPREQICMGAWRAGNENRYWGVGYGGRKGCTGCCYNCGNGEFVTKLNAGPATNDYATTNNGSEAFSSFINGLAIGGAIYNSTRSTPSYTTKRIRRPTSDISGTK